MDTAIISAVLPMLIKGFWVTMEIAVVGILLGFLLGAVSGYALQGKCRVARTAAGVYIWLIRGTPIVVQASSATSAFANMISERQLSVRIVLKSRPAPSAIPCISSTRSGRYFSISLR